MLDEMYIEKKNVEKVQNPKYHGWRNFNQPLNRQSNQERNYNKVPVEMSNMNKFQLGKYNPFARNCYSNPKRQPDKKIEGSQTKSQNDQVNRKQHDFSNKSERADSNPKIGLVPSPASWVCLKLERVNSNDRMLTHQPHVIGQQLDTMNELVPTSSLNSEF